MIRLKLREVMAQHAARTGNRHTYVSLAEACGVSPQTLQSLATRSTYNPTLQLIDQLCSQLGCGLLEILEYQPGSDPSQN